MAGEKEGEIFTNGKVTVMYTGENSFLVFFRRIKDWSTGYVTRETFDKIYYRA